MRPPSTSRRLTSPGLTCRERNSACIDDVDLLRHGAMPVLFGGVRAPVIAGARLRGGNASSARGAASMITEAVTTARTEGA
jgi:hypothetical protein